MGKFQDLTGQKFNRLTVIKYLGKSYWLCKCSCGNLKKIRGDHLRDGITSCGCYTKEIAVELARQMGYKNRKYKNLPYDKKQQKIKSIWEHMIGRCKDKNSIYYQRGIKVCEEWLNFENFYYWVINRNDFDEQKNRFLCSIDRIDNNGNYEPNNCRFITYFEQQRNKSDNWIINYNGEIHCLKDWENIYKIPNLKYRIMHNFPLEKIFTSNKYNSQRRIRNERFV